MDREVRKLVTTFNDYSHFATVHSILLNDRQFLAFNLSELHFRCANLLKATNAKLAEEHHWLSVVFNVEISNPVFGKRPELLRPSRILDDPIDHWKQIPMEGYRYLVATASSVQNPRVRLYLYSALWDSRVLWSKELNEISVPAVAESLVEAALECAKVEIGSGIDLASEGMRCVECLGLTAFIGTKFKLHDGLKEILPKLFEFAERLFADAPHWSLDLMRVAAYLASPKGQGRCVDLVTDNELRAALQMTERLRMFYDSAPGAKSPEEVLGVVFSIERILGMSVSQNDYNKRLAEGYLSRAQHAFPGWLRANTYKDAAERFHAAGLREEAAVAKRKSREVMQESIENDEMTAVGTTLTFTAEQMEEMIEPFFKETDHAIDVLFRLGRHLFADSIQTQTTPSGRLVFRQLIATVPVVDDRVKATQDPAEGNSNGHLKEAWLHEIQLANVLQLSPIFEKLKSKYGLGFSDLYAGLAASEKWRDQDRVFIRRAVQEYLSEDYLSFIHLFVPRLEQLIRLLLSSVGLDVTAFREGDLLEKPLGELLREALKKQAMPVEIIQLLQATLSEEWGLNLRNRVAHGLITEEQCSEDVAHRVVHLGILLNQLR